MSVLLIWMNSHEAKLFHLKTQSIHVENMSYNGRHYPIESLGASHPQKQTAQEAFYRELAKKLSNSTADKWLLMGPTLTPKHFFQFLKIHHPELGQRVIGTEKVEQMPDSEILSVGRHFLHNYYLLKDAN